ncbi:DnaA N-terminal domain-containing protein [Crassaminicella profunda]|uniref:DnaA N-terminal domain-containing protein n=1 Tax=Crassaminicella profunda TaxID=1286698 RepID=UPI001CA79E73|nr:DnaA N-terminal domain-containing protein [Crassaminicella profunda]QZY55572.1 hypothetical protein K7H06_00555 [Crassaminicella profunda]
MEKILDEILMEIRGIKETVDSIDERLKKLETVKSKEYYIDKRLVPSNDKIKPDFYRIYDSEFKDVWNKAIELIKAELTEVSFNTWIKNIKFLGNNQDDITISVPNDFSKGLIEARYLKLIQASLEAIAGKIYKVKILVDDIDGLQEGLCKECRR